MSASSSPASNSTSFTHLGEAQFSQMPPSPRTLGSALVRKHSNEPDKTPSLPQSTSTHSEPQTHTPKHPQFKHKIEKPIPTFLKQASSQKQMNFRERLAHEYEQTLLRKRAAFLGQPDPTLTSQTHSPKPQPVSASLPPIPQPQLDDVEPNTNNPAPNSTSKSVDRTASASAQTPQLPKLPTPSPSHRKGHRKNKKNDLDTPQMDIDKLDLADDQQWEQFQKHMIKNDPVSKYMHEHIGALPRHVPIKQWGSMAQAIFHVDTKQFDQLGNAQLDLLNQDPNSRQFAIDGGIDKDMLHQASNDADALDKRMAKGNALAQSGLDPQFNGDARPSALTLKEEHSLGKLDAAQQHIAPSGGMTFEQIAQQIQQTQQQTQHIAPSVGLKI